MSSNFVPEGGEERLEAGVDGLGLAKEAHMHHVGGAGDRVGDAAAKVLHPVGQVGLRRENVDEIAVAVVGLLQLEPMEC